jgi:hypothetical protein
MKNCKGGVEIVRILIFFPHSFHNFFHNNIGMKTFDNEDFHSFPQNWRAPLLFLIKKKIYTEYLTLPSDQFFKLLRSKSRRFCNNIDRYSILH